MVDLGKLGDVELEAFKGNNALLLNEATMIKIVQHYFDTVAFASGKAPKVTSVQVKTAQLGYSPRDVFEVSVGEEDE